MNYENIIINVFTWTYFIFFLIHMSVARFKQFSSKWIGKKCVLHFTIDDESFSVFVASLYILESSKKKVFVLLLSWSQQFKQSKKLIFVNEGGPVYTPNKYRRLVECKNNLIKLWIFLLLFANYISWCLRQESQKPQRFLAN